MYIFKGCVSLTNATHTELTLEPYRIVLHTFARTHTYTHAYVISAYTHSRPDLTQQPCHTERPLCVFLSLLRTTE